MSQLQQLKETKEKITKDLDDLKKELDNPLHKLYEKYDKYLGLKEKKSTGKFYSKSVFDKLEKEIEPLLASNEINENDYIRIIKTKLMIEANIKGKITVLQFLNTKIKEEEYLFL